MAAPVCPVSRDEVIGQPSTANIPNIPLANDLPSALAAINAMRQAVMIMNNRIIINNTYITPGKQGGNSSTKTKPPSDGDFKEVAGTRQTKTVRVEQEGNPNNFVEFEQINSLTLKDKNGETWVWKRG